MSSNLTLYNLLNYASTLWIENEKKDDSSVVGNLIKNIEEKGKFRIAQIEAIKIYLWLKEIGNSKKLSDLIKSNIMFEKIDVDDDYPGDLFFKDNPVKRFLNRYFIDANIKNINNLMNSKIDDIEYETLLDNLFEDFNYSNYLFSLPMGAGKTYLIAAFIYIDLYMKIKVKSDKNYPKNFIILIPSARKNSILPSLRTIKNFNPEWIFNKYDARELKNILKFEVLDEIPDSDRLQNQNPNLSKINKSLMSKDYGNIFIINAEKLILDDNRNNKKSVETKVKKAIELKDAMAQIPNVEVFIDEAHHSYSDESNRKKIRTVLDVINKNKNIICCIGMSGTPYVSRTVTFMNTTIKLGDIQDIVYYYPLDKAIGNFLKFVDIEEISTNEKELINNALDLFFHEYDITYKNNTKSKIAFYCSNIEILNNEILPQIIEWYDKHNRNKNEIFKYYNSLPPSAYQEYLSLDSPNSKYRVILLVAVGTEGWDCRSLTSVVLPRKMNRISSKNFVLQTTCRCLREVENAKKERALVCLNKQNFDILNKELNSNYHLSIKDINKKANFKDYPVCKTNPINATLEYYNIKEIYAQQTIVEKCDFKDFLSKYEFDNFKQSANNDYRNQIKITTIKGTNLNDSAIYKDLDFEDYDFSFEDFLYLLEKTSYGIRINSNQAITCSWLMKYESELRRIYNEINSQENKKWIANHPKGNTILTEIGKSITIGLCKKCIYKKEKIEENVKINLLDWNIENCPTIAVNEEDAKYVYPKNSFDDLLSESSNLDIYEENKKRLQTKFEWDNTPNKDKSFNYIPYKMDSSYEFNFLEEILKNISDKNIEIYYNGYKNSDLESFRICTPYGLYTPDFLILKRNDDHTIKKILIIETKGKPYETPLKEEFIKNVFLPENNQRFKYKKFDYKRIGDIQKDISAYNEIIKIIDKFNSN